MKTALFVFVLAVLAGCTGKALEPAATVTAVPPTPTLKPTRVLLPSEALRREIDEALGESNRGGRKLTDFEYSFEEGSITVVWAADDGFDVRDGIERDLTTVLRLVDGSILPARRYFTSATFAVTDVYGRDREAPVMTAAHTSKELDKVKWENFDHRNIFAIAEAWWVDDVVD